MNRRFLSALFALSFSLSPAIAACGGDDSADTKSTSLSLSGVYRPVDQGPIGSITFSGSSDYLLVPTGCSGGGCAEIGTYRLDAASKVLLLENARTHEARSIALEVVKTSDATPSLVKSVKPLDLVDPGDQLTKNGQETTTGGGQQLATGGNATTGAAQQLLQLIKEAIMNGQQMKQDDKGGQPPQAPQAAQAPQAPQPSPMMADPQPDAMAAPMSDCKQGIPTKDTSLAEVAAYFARCPKGP